MRQVVLPAVTVLRLKASDVAEPRFTSPYGDQDDICKVYAPSRTIKSTTRTRSAHWAALEGLYQRFRQPPKVQRFGHDLTDAG